MSLSQDFAPAREASNRVWLYSCGTAQELHLFPVVLVVNASSISQGLYARCSGFCTACAYKKLKCYTPHYLWHYWKKSLIIIA